MPEDFPSIRPHQLSEIQLHPKIHTHLIILKPRVELQNNLER